MTLHAPCVNSEGRRKASYPSEHAAKAALERSPRWRLRKSWPVSFRCSACLGTALRLVRERWLTQERALTGQTLKGLASFLVLARQDPRYDEARLEDVMLRHAPLNILQRAQELAVNESAGAAQVRHMALAFAEKYNQRLSPQRKIALKVKRT